MSQSKQNAHQWKENRRQECVMARMLVPKLVSNGFYSLSTAKIRLSSKSKMDPHAQKTDLRPFLTILGTHMRAKVGF